MKNLTRLNGSIDPALMRQTKITAIGIGGALNLYENLVRANLGKLVAMDFDIVDSSNLTTQGFRINDVGMYKVDALEKYLNEISDDFIFNGLKADFLKISDQDMNSLMNDTDLFLFMTDNFYAQALGNVLALQYQKPAVFAMVYEKARCAEVIFIIPGVTPGCFRCAVSARYNAYLQENYNNEITSVGSTIFHTHYLNQVIGMITLAIIHNNTKDLEFSNWFGNYWDRNLIQIRMHPAYSSNKNNLFNRLFGEIPQVFSFDSVWQKIEHECPPKYDFCPDCGGTGDLRNAIKYKKFSSAI